MRELTARGHDVVVQSGAGAGIFADNDAYVKAGASTADGSAVFAEAEMVGKVKEPQAVKYGRLKQRQFSSPIFTWHQIRSRPAA